MKSSRLRSFSKIVRPDPGHDAHADRDVARVGDHHAGLGVGRVGVAHHVGNDVHRPAGHAAVRELGHQLLGLGRLHPVVVGAGGVLGRVADEGQLLGPGDVVRGGAMEVGRRPGLLVERLEDGPVEALLVHADLEEPPGLAVRAVAPVDPGRLGQPLLFLDPTFSGGCHVRQPPFYQSETACQRAEIRDVELMHLLVANSLSVCLTPGSRRRRGSRRARSPD